MQSFTFIYDIITNYLMFFTLEIYVSYSNNYKINTIVKRLRPFFIICLTIISIIPRIPLFELLSLLIDYLYLSFATSTKLSKRIFSLLKYYCIFYSLFTVIYFIRTCLLSDYVLQKDNTLYNSFSSLSCTAITYILFSLYVNRKRIKSYQKGKSYMRQFNFISIITICALTLSTFLLDTSLFSVEQTVPLIFTFIIIVVSICLYAYQKIATTVEENAQAQLQLEKAKLEQGYYAAIEQKLNEIRTLRHDMNNHLVIINGYAGQNKNAEISQYINQIRSQFSHTHIIRTESEVISSIVNAKADDCSQRGIRFEFLHQFSTVTIDDYSLITILGNLLDNAISAADKTSNGYVRLHMKELDSYLSIQCENNHCEQIQKKEDGFVSTKAPSSEIHGLGLKSIEKTVAALRGTLEIQFDNTVFRVLIMLPNY